MTSTHHVYVNGRFLLQEMTGVQRYALHMTSELARADFGVTVLIPPGELASEVPDGVDVVEVGSRGGHAWEQVDLRSYLKGLGSPLLLNLSNSGVVGYRNQVVTRHDVAYVRVPSSYSFSYRWLYRLLSRPLLGRSRGVLTVSDFSKREISELHHVSERQIRVVPNAVDDRFGPVAPADASGQPYILAVSSPAPHKNFAGLVSSFAMTRGLEGHDLRIVGSISGRAFSGAALPESPRITYLGRVGDDELVRLYQGAAAYVSLSRYEGFGIGCIEAQRCGCPVVASNAAAHVEVLGDSAIIVDPDDWAAVGTALTRLVTDQTLAARVRSDGLVNAARFSWHESGRELAVYLEELFAAG